jgi:hypothetical protein
LQLELPSLAIGIFFFSCATLNLIDLAAIRDADDSATSLAAAAAAAAAATARAAVAAVALDGLTRQRNTNISVADFD